MTDPWTIALITVTFLTAGLIKGVIGLGMPVVVLAFLATTIGLKPALALMVFPGVIGNVWQAATGGAFVSNLRRLWPLLATSVITIWIGVAVLARADAKWLTVFLGLVLSAYSALSLLKLKLPPPGEREGWMTPLIGAISGLMFGMTGTYMVPGVLYIEALGLKRDAFVQALGMTFLTIVAALAVGLAANGLLSSEATIASALSLIPLFAGLVIGSRIRRYVPEALFRQLFFCWLFLTGIVIAVRALPTA